MFMVVRLSAKACVMSQSLHPHRDCPAPSGVSVSVSWEMLQQSQMIIEYSVIDPETRIRWPLASRAPVRTDNLWQHTCFEAFVGSASDSAYVEFNLAPSGPWAAYAFDSYRQGMQDLVVAADPVVAAATSGTWTATLDLTGIEAVIGSAPWRLAITAVIEADDGSKSYWSLAHPAGKPDFHHADCFAARLG